MSDVADGVAGGSTPQSLASVCSSCCGSFEQLCGIAAIFMSRVVAIIAATLGTAVQASNHHQVIITTPQRCGSHFLSGLLGLGGEGHGILSGGEHHPKGSTPDECWSSILNLLDKHSTIILHMSAWCGMHPRQMGTRIRQNSSVKVLHGRRAALMALSDTALAAASDKAFGTHVSNVRGMLNYSTAETLERMQELTERHRLNTSQELAQRVRDYEARERKFVDDLGDSLVGSGQLMEYDYESLLLPLRHDHLARIFQFILGSSKSDMLAIMASKAFRSSENNDGATLAGTTLHPPTCSSRVTDWPKLRTMLSGTNTLTACDRMELYYVLSQK